MSELQVDRVSIVDDGKPAVFVLHIGGRVTPEFAEEITHAWRCAWMPEGQPDGAVPRLIVLEAGMMITALSNAELLKAGLMKIDRVPQ